MPLRFRQNIAAELGITGVSTNPFDWGVPAIGFTNFGGLSDPLPSLSRPQTVRANDTLIWNHGKAQYPPGRRIAPRAAEYRDRPQRARHLQLHRLQHQQLQQRLSRARQRAMTLRIFCSAFPQTTSVRFGVASNYLRNLGHHRFLSG